MTHYFSRMRLNEANLEPFVRDRALNAYNIHREVWKLFPDRPDAPRDFVYSVLDGGRTIYCVSETEPVSGDGRWIVETKPYDPMIGEGEFFRFYACVNPTVANSNTGKHQRHDVIMDLKRRVRESGDDMSMAEMEHEAMRSWMDRKGALNGFEIPFPDDMLVHSYERHESYKAGVHKITFSSVVVEGILRVTDVEPFRNMLFRGLGSAKGFGCGMVMIKRPRCRSTPASSR